MIKEDLPVSSATSTKGGMSAFTPFALLDLLGFFLFFEGITVASNDSKAGFSLERLTFT